MGNSDNVIGYIEYLSDDGKIVGYVTPFTDVDRFKKEILEAAEVGMPITPVVFPDKMDKPLGLPRDIYWPGGFRKVGYVFLTINEKTHQSESCEDLHTAPQLCRRLLDDMAITVMMQTKRNHNFTNMDKDEAVRVRAFWKPVIEKLPDYAYLCDEILREAQENEEENGIDLQ